MASGQLGFKDYELNFSRGLIAKIIGKQPIPPRELKTQEAIAWGDGYIYGGREKHTKEDIKRLWLKSGLSGRKAAFKRINS